MSQLNKLNVRVGQLISKFAIVMMVIATAPVNAQNFGGNAPSVKWRQINTDAAKVIYPKGLDSLASRAATLASYLQQNPDGTVGNSQRKISIVLQPDATLSNAYVGLGPWRSEFYLTAPQNPFELGSISWVDNLVVHEYKHVQQYNNYRKGLSAFMGVLFGHYGRLLANGMAVPDWYFEGDATWSETVHSGQGRGRLPLFLNAYRTVNEANRQYSLMKMRNGSLRQYVPNHYELGYLLVSYGRQAFGDSVWNTISEDAAAFKGLLYPWQAAVKRHTGIRYKQLVNNAMDDFRKKANPTQFASPIWLTNASDKWMANYKYPYPDGQGNAVVLKSTDKQIPVFVAVAADGSEQKIAVKDIGYDDYYSYKNGRIVYSALQTDARWGNRDFSVIRMLDIATHQIFSITHRSKYFSPDISNDGQTVVAVEMKPSGRSQLVLLNTEGKVLKHFTPDSTLVFSHPKFLANESEVLVASRSTDGQMGWMIWETENQQFRWLLAPAYRLVGMPQVQGDTVTYTATEGGRDALYAQLITSGKRFSVAGFSTGIYQGYFAGADSVVVSCNTVYGQRLGKMAASFTPVLTGKPNLEPLYDPNQRQHYFNVSNIVTKQFSNTKFGKLNRPFNFHSWIPEVDDKDYTLRLIGNNVINTTQTDLFYTYNTNEKSNAAGFNFTYGAWFLQPTVGVKQTWGREVVYNADTTFLYNETEASAGFRLPLNLTGGKQFRYLTLTSTVHTDRVKWTGIGNKLLDDLDFTYLQTRMVYSGQIQKARQHIYPHWAQALVADYRTMVDNNSAWQFLLSGSFYLPGLSANHSLVITGAVQARDTLRQFGFSNSFPFSRGYISVNYPRMYKLGVNYHFPIAYPDWGFGHMLYIMRIRANAFYDYTSGKSLRTGLSTSFASAGGELFFDTKIWNQVPISVGMRYSHLLNAEYNGTTPTGYFEFILPVNLF